MHAYIDAWQMAKITRETNNGCDLRTPLLLRLMWNVISAYCVVWHAHTERASVQYV